MIASTVVTGLAIGGGIGPAAQRGGRRRGAGLQRRDLPHRVRAPDPERRGSSSSCRASRSRRSGAFALQSLGGWYVDRTITDASAIYGTFALVIGLLPWFFLVSHLLLVAAEVNVVLRWRLWPRSLAGELEPADRRALSRVAEAARMDRRQEIEVDFGDAE